MAATPVPIGRTSTSSPGPGVDILADLDDCERTPLPFDEDSIAEIAASHLLEHIRNPLPLLQELHRLAAPGARAVFRVPYGSSDDANEDPTHVRRYYAGSFGYFAQPTYWRANYGYRGDWQPEKLTLVVDRRRFLGKSPREVMRQVESSRKVVREMIAELRAVKPIREARRELMTDPAIEIKLA